MQTLPNTRLTLLYLLNRNAIGSIELEVIASEDVQDSKNQVSVFCYFNGVSYFNFVRE